MCHPSLQEITHSGVLQVGLYDIQSVERSTHMKAVQSTRTVMKEQQCINIVLSHQQQNRSKNSLGINNTMVAKYY